MIVYNITMKVDASIETAFVEWLQDVHLPQVLATGCFTSSRLMRLLEVDDSEGPTFAVQFTAPTTWHYEKYLKVSDEIHRKTTQELWGNRYIAFRSVMELVQ